jgi:hypothetical protein
MSVMQSQQPLPRMAVEVQRGRVRVDDRSIRRIDQQHHRRIVGELMAVGPLALTQRRLLGADARVGTAQQDINGGQQQHQQQQAGGSTQGEQARKGRIGGGDVAHDQQVSDFLARNIAQRHRGDPPVPPARGDIPVRSSGGTPARHLVGIGCKGIGQTPLRGVDHHAAWQALPVSLAPEQAHARFPALPVQVLLADDQGQLAAG